MEWSTAMYAILPAVTALAGIVIGKGLDRWDRRDINAREDEVARAKHQEWIDQQWWEKKSAAYSRIVEILGRLVEEYQDWVFHNYGEQVPDQISKQIERSWVQLHYELKSVYGAGAYLISDRATEALRMYMRKADLTLLEEDDSVFADRAYEGSKGCLEIVREEALSDLGVKKANV